MTALEELRVNGIVRVDGLTPIQAWEARCYLGAREMFSGHVKQRGRQFCKGDIAGCWGMEDVVGAPHLFELGLRYTPMAQDYLGQEPRMYSMNVFSAFPSDQPMSRDIQEYHRDKDDVRFLALFVYLTDVDAPEDGAHQFVRGSHNGMDTGVEMVLGPAGSAFLADTRGLHLGLRPRSKERTIAWVRWCVSDPPLAYVWDRLSPVSRSVLGNRYPSDPDMQRVVRLVTT